jgi:hypothetical protein
MKETAEVALEFVKDQVKDLEILSGQLNRTIVHLMMSEHAKLQGDATIVWVYTRPEVLMLMSMISRQFNTVEIVKQLRREVIE